MAHIPPDEFLTGFPASQTCTEPHPARTVEQVHIFLTACDPLPTELAHAEAVAQRAVADGLLVQHGNGYAFTAAGLQAAQATVARLGGRPVALQPKPAD